MIGLLHGCNLFFLLMLRACDMCATGETLGLSISQSNLLARSASSSSLAKALALASSSGAPGLVTAGECDTLLLLFLCCLQYLCL
jgi:hypothetical protein